MEMCEPASIRYTSGSGFTVSNKAEAQACVKRTYEAAVELFAMLCKKYGLNPMKDICSHKEGHAKGIASNHGDPEHLWKGVGLNYTMDTFRQAVKAKMDGQTVPTPTLSANGSFMVRVSISNLNIRKGPGTDYAKTGKYTGKGSFTIVETKTGKGSKKGWGKLKSGAGWISLDYCQKC